MRFIRNLNSLHTHTHFLFITFISSLNLYDHSNLQLPENRGNDTQYDALLMEKVY